MKVLLNTRRTELFIITGRGCSAGMHFIAVHPAGQFMKAGGNGPSHSKRKTTCLIALQSLCPGAPRSAWVATVHIFGIFFFSFFYFFSFFRPRGGGRVGHVEGQDPQGYVVLRTLFCYLGRLPAIRIRRMAIARFPKFIAYSRHQFRVRCRYWPDYSPWSCWSLRP